MSRPLTGSLVAAGLFALSGIVALLLVPVLIVLAAFNLDAWAYYALLALASLVWARIGGTLAVALAAQDTHRRVVKRAERLMGR